LPAPEIERTHYGESFAAERLAILLSKGPIHLGVNFAFLPMDPVLESKIFCPIQNLCGTAFWSKLTQL
jgi:hypothetical protein